MLDITGINPFRMLPTGNEAAIWVKTNRVCVVEYMPNTMNSLRQPVFKGFRDDVFPEEVQIEQKKGGLDFSHPPVYNLIKKGNQMQDLMPSVKFNLFLC